MKNIKIRKLTMLLAKVLVLSLAVFALTTCKKSKETTENSNGTTNTNIKPNVLVVNEQLLKPALLEVDSDRVVFQGGAANVGKLQIGSVLVGDTSKQAPSGFLRKIISMSNNNGQITCMTSQAALTDVIQNGSFTKVMTFTLAGLPSSDTVLMDKKRSKNLASYTNQQSLSFSHQFGANNDVTVSGSLGLTVTVTLDLVIKDATIQKFDVSADITKSISINAVANDAITEALVEYPFKPIYLGNIDVLILDIVPVNFNVNLLCSAGIEGNISSKISMSAANTDETVEGISYLNGNWTPTSSQNNNISFQPPNLTVASEIKPYLKAKLQFVPYGINLGKLASSDIYLQAEAYADADASLNTSNGLDITTGWGIELSGGADLTVLGSSISYSNTFFQKFYPFSQSTIGLPSVTTSAISQISSSGAAAGGSITGDGGTAVTARGVCWSTSTNPTVGSSKSSDGKGTGSFTSLISGLQSSTQYHVRAYSTNAIGTAYGTDVTFTTLAGQPQTGTLQASGNLSFGSVQVNTTATQQLQLSNYGAAPITVSNITVSAPFYCNTTSTTVPANNSVYINITFTPTSTGSFNSPLYITSNASDSQISLSAGGSGVSGTQSGGTSSNPTSSPTLGNYGPCAGTEVSNASCPMFVDGEINARVVSANPSTHTIVFEINKCNGSAFNTGGYINVVNLLCGTGVITYNTVQFQPGSNTAKVTVTDNSMSGSKVYHVYIYQTVGSYQYYYDAPPITITY